MSRFSARDSTSNVPNGMTVNRAGGLAYDRDLKQKLATLVLTSFLDDQYYRTAGEAQLELASLCNALIDRGDIGFVEQACEFARVVFGMRSVSHVMAGELAHSAHRAGQLTVRGAVSDICLRPDDAIEIVAYYLGRYGKPLPNSLKKGIADALSEFDEYQLGKYRGEGKSVNLYDVVNLCHPKSTPALEKLMKGTLPAPYTWEVELTRVGELADGPQAATKMRAEVWTSLITSGRLGYLALIRNLRNILWYVTDDAVIMHVCEQIVDSNRLRKSRVFPFQIATALGVVEGLRHSGSIPRQSIRRVSAALEQAIDRSVMANIPEMPGRTLVAIDHSGSMTELFEKAAIFAAGLFAAMDADVIVFSSDAEYARYRDAMPPVHGTDSPRVLRAESGVWQNVQKLRDNFMWGGTNFHSIFLLALRAGAVYDRIFILSDEQAWMGHHTPEGKLDAYKRKTGADPFIYSIDVAGYGTTVFSPERKVAVISGFSEKIFDLIQWAENDPSVLVSAIEQYVPGSRSMPRLDAEE